MCSNQGQRDGRRKGEMEGGTDGGKEKRTYIPHSTEVICNAVDEGALASSSRPNQHDDLVGHVGHHHLLSAAQAVHGNLALCVSAQLTSGWPVEDQRWPTAEPL